MAPGGDAIERCPRCGLICSGERTGKAHRFFHAILGKAWENWPDRHRFQPSSPNHLRAWFMCHDAVRFCSEVDAAPEGVAAIEAMLAAVRASGGYAFVVPEYCRPPQEGVDRNVVPDEDAGKLRLRIPRSSALRKNGGELTAGKFYALLDRLLAAIEQETGITRQDLRREGLAAVAARPKLGKRRA